MASKSAKNSNLSLIIGILALIGAILAAILALKPAQQAAPSSASNGAPSGAHYNLNIIGVPKGKTADMTGSQGKRIFVPLAGNCKISLKEGAFEVLDGNCTDGKSDRSHVVL